MTDYIPTRLRELRSNNPLITASADRIERLEKALGDLVTLAETATDCDAAIAKGVSERKKKSRLEQENSDLRRQLREHRKAIRLLFKSEWMHSCDWADMATRDAMWKEVKRLTGMRGLS